jgi:hypothetical protein
MSGIFGHLNISDTERVFAATLGQQVLFEEARKYLDRVNQEMNQFLGVFVEETTENYKMRYKLPGGGHLQRRGPDGRYGAVKAYGYWDVALPREDFGAQIAGNDVDMAYMTVQELDNHISTVVLQNANTVRFELLKALINNTADTFTDPLWGSLTIQPLANGDTVVYPPVLGSESEATEDHYLEAGYLATAIDDTHNPYITIRDDLIHHYGISGDGYNIAVFINGAEAPETEALTDFDPVTDPYVQPGANPNTLFGLPAGLPGAVIGRTNGVWVIRWDWVPATYMIGVHLDAPKPLKMRVDPADTGLGRGLQLVARDEQFPFESSFWRHRFGLGCGNRLNGVVMELAAGGSYTIATGYS